MLEDFGIDVGAERLTIFGEKLIPGFDDAGRKRCIHVLSGVVGDEFGLLNLIDRVKFRISTASKIGEARRNVVSLFDIEMPFMPQGNTAATVAAVLYLPAESVNAMLP